MADKPISTRIDENTYKVLGLVSTVTEDPSKAIIERGLEAELRKVCKRLGAEPRAVVTRLARIRDVDLSEFMA